MFYHTVTSLWRWADVQPSEEKLNMVPKKDFFKSVVNYLFLFFVNFLLFFFCLTVFILSLTLSLSLSLSLFLSLFLTISVCLSVCLSLSLSVSVSISLFSIIVKIFLLLWFIITIHCFSPRSPFVLNFISGYQLEKIIFYQSWHLYILITHKLHHWNWCLCFGVCKFMLVCFFMSFITAFFLWHFYFKSDNHRWLAF